MLPRDADIVRPRGCCCLFARFRSPQLEAAFAGYRLDKTHLHVCARGAGRGQFVGQVHPVYVCVCGCA